VGEKGNRERERVEAAIENEASNFFLIFGWAIKCVDRSLVCVCVCVSVSE